MPARFRNCRTMPLWTPARLPTTATQAKSSTRDSSTKTGTCSSEPTRARGREGQYNTRMVPQWTPFRWPARWTDPSALTLLEGTPINHLLMDSAGSLDGIRARAKQMGIAAGAAPAGVTVVKGEWPGVQMPGGSGQGAGPTGVPWVDSNG